MSGSDPIELAASVVAAFVSYNSVPVAELPTLIEAVHGSVKRCVDGTAAQESLAQKMEARTPAVSIRKSITPDYLICLEDGKRFKSLRRHLRGLGLTPEQYRERWGLPADYHMVAPNYAAQRSALAKQIGLGQIRKTQKKGRLSKTAA